MTKSFTFPQMELWKGHAHADASLSELLKPQRIRKTGFAYFLLLHL